MDIKKAGLFQLYFFIFKKISFLKMTFLFRK